MFFISSTHYNFEALVGVDACRTHGDYFKKHGSYYRSGHRMHEALPSPPVGPSPFCVWLEAQYSIISNTPSPSHSRQILPRFSTRTRIAEESARNLWGCVRCSFDAGRQLQLSRSTLPASSPNHAFAPSESNVNVPVLIHGS